MEIEIRAFIENIEEFKKKLETIGGVFVTQKHIIDTWFCTRDKTHFNQVRQHEPGSYGLRIRQSFENDNEVAELNAKVLEELGDHNAFHEYETEVDDKAQAKKILESIGFKVFCVMDKIRTVYKLGECLVNIEDIKGYRPAVELEIISDEDIEKHREYLKELLNKLGIKEQNKIKNSITYEFMKEFSFKQVFQ